MLRDVGGVQPTGGVQPLTTVVEVEYTPHPARSFTPPDQRAYALVAARNIAKGEPVEVYGGNLWTNAGLHEASVNGEVEEFTDHYAYDINIEQLRAAGYTGDNLTLENKRVSSRARFVNCCQFRGESRRGNTAKHVNMHAELWWNDERSLPAVVFMAERAVQKVGTRDPVDTV